MRTPAEGPRRAELAIAIVGAGLGDDLEDAAAGATEGARDRVDGEAVGAKLKDAGAARGWIGDFEAIAAEDLRERAGGEMADGSAERIGGLGGLRDVNAGAAEGLDEAGGAVVADEIDETLEHRGASAAGAGGGMRGGTGTALEGGRWSGRFAMVGERTVDRAVVGSRGGRRKRDSRKVDSGASIGTGNDNAPCGRAVSVNDAASPWAAEMAA